ncbi:MAG: PH domain-containing protein [Proteobacteria bacterium]|nr:PH domain-containing protein [Pseudomonadota bacterium]
MRTTLRENEQVLLVTRKHWIELVRPVLALVGVAALVVLICWGEARLGAGEAEGSALVIGPWSALLLVVPALWLGWRLLARRYDIWVVTDRRVIDEEGVISLTAMESPLSKVNNVSLQQGLLGRLLGYGDVQIQTAAEMGATTYARVAAPRRLKDAITQAQDLQQERGAALQAQHFARAAVPAEDALGADTRSCPFCAEAIKTQATICRFCQRELPAA